MRYLFVSCELTSNVKALKLNTYVFATWFITTDYEVHDHALVNGSWLSVLTFDPYHTWIYMDTYYLATYVCVYVHQYI